MPYRQLFAAAVVICAHADPARPVMTGFAAQTAACRNRLGAIIDGAGGRSHYFVYQFRRCCLIAIYLAGRPVPFLPAARQLPESSPWSAPPCAWAG